MTKNLKEEQIENNSENCRKNKLLYQSALGGGLILLICMGICVGFDLHQTKVINSEVLPQMQAEYVSRIADLHARIELMQREINKLQSLKTSDNNGLNEKYLDDRLSSFEQELFSKLPNGEGKQILQNNARIAMLEKAFTEMKESQNQENTMPQEVLLASGALTIRSLAENGENFAYEAEILQIMATGNKIAERYLAEIRRFAANPPLTKNILIKDFKRIYASLGGTEVSRIQTDKQTNEEASWKDAFLSRLKSFISFKNKNETIKFEQAPDEVYSLVEDGNLAQALNRLRTDNKYALLNSSAIKVWEQNVQNYLAFDHAVNGLIMNAIAHIRLRQLEHDN